MKELSLHILDLVENSVKAGAKLIEITVTEKISDNIISFEIKDNGCGMDKEFLENVVNPFTTTRTTRKVGLGIPLTKLACEQAGGCFHIESTPGVGTYLKAAFMYDHIDRQPLGDIKSTVLTLITMRETTDFIYTHTVNDKDFKLDTRELKEILGGVSFNEPDVRNWLNEYLGENIESLYI